MDKLDKIEAKVDMVIDEQHKNNIILAINTEHLAAHMKRTALLEARVEPIENTYKESIGIIKFFTLLSMLAVIVDVAIRILKKS